MTTATSTQAPSITEAEARKSAAEYLKQRLVRTAADGTKAFAIPVIDISASYSASLGDRQAVADQIHDACVSSGFFHIVGHNVPVEYRTGVLRQAERLFKDLPQAAKDAIHVNKTTLFRGWEPSDYSATDPDSTARECKEGFNWGYEPALDPTGGDGKYVELDGSTEPANQWPSEKDVPGFFDAIKDYYGQVLQLARHLFRLFALSLRLPETHFDEMMTHPGGIARLIYYPPNKDPQPLDPNTEDKEIGLGAHSDYECFTLLLTTTATGLEILSPDGVWTAAPAVDGSFIVNVADFLMRWTNDKYKSTVHRVVNRTHAERYSVPFFFSINYDQLVETLPSCVTPENPSKYAPVKAGDYILKRLEATI